MSKVFPKSTHGAPAAHKQPRPLTGRGATGRKRKSISFDANRNKVRFIRVPPRSQNPQYWFSERQRMVKKGLNFEIEPEISVEVNVDSRLTMGAIAYPTAPNEQNAAASASASPSSSPQAAGRAYLEVKEMHVSLLGSFGGNPDDDEDGSGISSSPWFCVGSVAAGEMAKLRVVLPPGIYQLRCVGNTSPLQLFGQAVDVERELY